MARLYLSITVEYLPLAYSDHAYDYSPGLITSSRAMKTEFPDLRGSEVHPWQSGQSGMNEWALWKVV